MNLNANAFTNETQNDYAKKVIAETYMQIYQYAAEDFTTHPDMNRFIIDLTSWMKSVDQRLTNLMNLISTILIKYLHIHMELSSIVLLLQCL